MCYELDTLQRHETYYRKAAWEKVMIFRQMQKKRETVPLKHCATISQSCYFTNVTSFKEAIDTFCNSHPLQKIESDDTNCDLYYTHPHFWSINHFYSDFPDAQNEKDQVDVITAIIAAEKAHLLEVIESINMFNQQVSNKNTHLDSCEMCKKLAGV